MTLAFYLFNFNEDWSLIILTNPVKVKDDYVEIEEACTSYRIGLNYGEIVKDPYCLGNFHPDSESHARNGFM